MILDRSSRWREQHDGWWEVGITIDLKVRWRIVEYALKSQVTKNQELHWKLLQVARGAVPAARGVGACFSLGQLFGCCARHNCVCVRRARVGQQDRSVADFLELYVSEDI
jgi:hypothetical protein